MRCDSHCAVAEPISQPVADRIDRIDMSQSRCPDAAELTEFLRGRLPPAESEALEQHLAECDACAQRLEACDASDPLVSFLKQGARFEAETVLHDDQFAARVVEQAREGRVESDDGPLEFPDVPGYEPLALIAQGGMGSVFKVRDRELGRLAALKIPRGDRRF